MSLNDLAHDEARTERLRQLHATLLEEEFLSLAVLAGLILRKELRGEELPPFMKACAREWSKAAKSFLESGGFAAADRARARSGARHFLEACAGELGRRMPQADYWALAKRGAEGYRDKVVGEISEAAPFGVVRERE